MAIKSDYDFENDILYFYVNEDNVDYSIDYDDIILDVSGKRITGIEIIDASRFLSITKSKEIKKFFSSLKNIKMDVEYKNNSISVSINLESSKSKENIYIKVPIKKELIVC
jgi:uncharacterized protein YuzE